MQLIWKRSYALARVLALVGFTGLLVLALMTTSDVLMRWQFVGYVDALKENGDRTWVLGWKVWPWWSVATVMLWLAAFVQAMVLIIDISSLFGGRDTDAALHNDPSSLL